MLGCDKDVLRERLAWLYLGFNLCWARTLDEKRQHWEARGVTKKLKEDCLNYMAFSGACMADTVLSREHRHGRAADFLTLSTTLQTSVVTSVCEIS